MAPERDPPIIATLGGYDNVPLTYVVREEWRDLATAWASANTPAAEVVAFGKNMMFWERHEEFNGVLDRFLKTLK
jgi:hypothetical protein